MNFKNLPIREGINIAGSLCSIFAVLMAFSITFNIAQWTVIIFGLVFGVCVFGLLLSCVRYISNKYHCLQLLTNSPFGLVVFWSIATILCLFIAFLLGMGFGVAVYVLFLMFKDVFSDLSTTIRL